MRDLLVILATMLTAATTATVAAMPALEWASAGQDWQITAAILWFCVCYGLCGYAAIRALTAYRAHCTDSVGRSQNS